MESTKRYAVDFYDMIDGWIESWKIIPERQFDDLEQAKAYRDRKNLNLDKANKRCGEHYGVIDMQTHQEVDCPLRK